jgi:hypothetical protein
VDVRLACVYLPKIILKTDLEGAEEENEEAIEEKDIKED